MVILFRSPKNTPTRQSRLKDAWELYDINSKPAQYYASNPQGVDLKTGNLLADACRERQDAVFDDTVKGHDKITTFAAIPYVLKYGHGVAYPNNWKDRGYDTAPVAAAIIR